MSSRELTSQAGLARDRAGEPLGRAPAPRREPAAPARERRRAPRAIEPRQRSGRERRTAPDRLTNRDPREIDVTYGDGIEPFAARRDRSDRARARRASGTRRSPSPSRRDRSCAARRSRWILGEEQAAGREVLATRAQEARRLGLRTWCRNARHTNVSKRCSHGRSRRDMQRNSTLRTPPSLSARCATEIASGESPTASTESAYCAASSSNPPSPQPTDSTLPSPPAPAASRSAW